MKMFIGITDWDWFRLLAAEPRLAEVNFWQPGGSRRFQTLAPGDLFLFKLHSPRNFIVGGGVFAHSTLLPVSLAWESFGIANGVRSLDEMRRRIERYRRRPSDRLQDYTIGCIVLTEPFFLPEAHWIPVPDDWSPNIVQGKTYDSTSQHGARLWSQLGDGRAGADLSAAAPGGALARDDGAAGRYGSPVLTRPRLGQGAFRVVVTDAYARRCAVSGERVLPVLEAAHIRPFAQDGAHQVENGLLLRSDLHALFDRGYLTVAPSLELEVSRRIRDEFENGRDYYALQGRPVRMPEDVRHRPSRENLVWHNENVYRG